MSAGSVAPAYTVMQPAREGANGSGGVCPAHVRVVPWMHAARKQKTKPCSSKLQVCHCDIPWLCNQVGAVHQSPRARHPKHFFTMFLFIAPGYDPRLSLQAQFEQPPMSKCVFCVSQHG